MSALAIKPIDDAEFGGKVSGLNPSAMTAAEIDAILAAYARFHGFLVFDFGRWLESEELHALTAVFGENEFSPGMIDGIGKRRLEGEQETSVDEQVAALRARGIDPYLMFIGNADPTTLEKRETDEKFYGEWEWHTDMSYIRIPPTFSLLHARKIPAMGGDTSFCNQVMAAAELPADLREKITGLEIKHDSTYSSSGVLRPGMTPPATPVDALGEPHPVLRRVPSTNDEALFLGRRTNAYVLSMSLDESEALLNELWAHATQPRFCYQHRWTVGEVVVWDNRMLMHKRSPVENDDVRFMWRTQTKGEAVEAAWA